MQSYNLSHLLRDYVIMELGYTKSDQCNLNHCSGTEHTITKFVWAVRGRGNGSLIESY